MNLLRIVTIGAVAAMVASPASAGELFGGVYIHDVKTPLTLSGVERGFDLQLGYRFDGIARTPIQPYAFVAANSAGKTHYAAVGVSAKFGKKIFIRPGIGLAVHSGSTTDFTKPGNGEIEFGSRILFEPELGVGAELNDRLSLEASWVHMSHATLFSGQNPGIDNIGARLTLKL